MHGRVPALLALLAAASTQAGEVALAPARGASQLQLQALPPPPKVVVRETSRYGTVTIDHEKHLALRVSCRRCHGPGVVSQISFTPQVAHERCVGCHREASRGPVRCAGCHVRSLPGEVAAREPASAPPAPARALAAEGKDPPALPAETAAPARSGAAPGRAPERVAAARSAREEPAAPQAGDREPEEERRTLPGRRTWRGRRPGDTAPAGATGARGSVPNPFAPGDPAQDIRSPNAGPPAPAPAVAGPPVGRPALLELGLNAGSGLGGSLRLSSAEGRFTRSYGIERVADSSSARMLLLLGLGTRRTLLPRVEASGAAIFGFDAQERPRLGFAPSLGARLGLDWRPPAGPVRSVQLSLTCTVGFAREAIGGQTGGPRVFATLSAGFRPPSS